MQIEEFGGTLRIFTCERMGGDVVDFAFADPDATPIIQRLEIVLARSQHCDLPVMRASQAKNSSQ